jgi:hypothetical protein
VESFRQLVYQPRDLALAEHQLIQRCMRERGFQYPADVPEPEDGNTALLSMPPRFTAEQARERGYGDLIRRESQPERASGANPLSDYVASLTADELARFTLALDDPGSAKISVSLPGGARMGAFSSGCRAQARLQTYGSVETYLTIRYLPQVAQSHMDNVESDRALREASKRYNRCMADSGYPLETPTAATGLAESYYTAGDTPAARQREIALAIQDATCQQQARIYEAYQEAVNRVAVRWIADNEAAVLAAADAQRAALDNARAILREGS